MKNIIKMLYLVIVVCLVLSTVGATGISPASKKYTLLPGQNQTFDFRVTDTVANNMSVQSTGELKEYIIPYNNTIEVEIPNQWYWTNVTIHMPDEIDPKSFYSNYIKVCQNPDELCPDSPICAIICAMMRLEITVPYYGKMVSGSMFVWDETPPTLFIAFKNIGDKILETLDGSFKVYQGAFIEEASMGTEINVPIGFDTNRFANPSHQLENGEYYASVHFDYDGETTDSGSLFSINNGLLPLQKIVCLPHIIIGNAAFKDGTNVTGAVVEIKNINTGEIFGGYVNLGVNSSWYNIDIGTTRGTCWSDDDLLDITVMKYNWKENIQLVVDGNLGGQVAPIIYINRDPEITRIYPKDIITIYEGEIQFFNISYLDFDMHDTVSIQWYLDGVPTVTTNEYTFNPGFDSVGNYNITVEISDGVFANSYTWIINVISRELRLYEGWNLISLPVQPINNSIEKVIKDLSGKIIVQNYNGSDWNSYDSEIPFNLNTLTKMNYGNAYWIKSELNQSLFFNGMIKTNYTVKMINGWNMVGYNNSIGLLPDVISDLTTPILVWTYYPEGWRVYDTSGSLPNTLDNMSSGKGYWIKSEDAQDWTI